MKVRGAKKRFPLPALPSLFFSSCFPCPFPCPFPFPPPHLLSSFFSSSGLHPRGCRVASHGSASTFATYASAAYSAYRCTEGTLTLTPPPPCSSSLPTRVTIMEVGVRDGLQVSGRKPNPIPNPNPNPNPNPHPNPNPNPYPHPKP